MAQEQAPVDRTGGRPLEAPRGGGRGAAGPTPGPGRRQRWPWPSRGTGSSRTPTQHPELCGEAFHLGVSGPPSNEHSQAEDPGTREARAAPTTQKSCCHQRPGHEGAPFPRPPRGEGRSTRKLRPCGAPRSCFHSGSWCWQRAAWSTSTGLDAGCASSGLPRAPRPSPSCSVYTSPSSPPATATVPAAPTAICQPPCQNGGSCVQPGRCHCPAGWQGNACQTDVDECSAGEGGCPQRCVNTAGSYWCQCWEGHRPSVDRAVCLPERGAPRVTPDPTTGADSEVKEEVQRLQSRVDVLEQKLQLVLAPLHSLASRALEHGLPDPGSLLAHSLQQLDRIDSLSEQISFLEEQLGSCSCKKEV
ncbi:epidermal growth factor-like protein 7 isoform X1 [Bos javanicus]|uniref:epidermal growth factor-like protein 7 isoform X1 n=1 Tax=Bos javanicus TaxID=9906 RepID=UPI002AA94EF0|nr:epidermal growth factor-like protein 7 isoform X1 [Bos javanicus]